LDWSPDDATFYFVDSLRRTIRAFDFEAATGALSAPRVFATLADNDGAPDGLCVDAQGGVWVAVFGGGRLLRYRPDGSLERTVPLPVPQPTSMAFGGADARTLFVTTARAGLDEAALAAAPLSGSVLALHPGVAGRPVTPFTG
jgi:sugar lactone lactonase YvrE